MIEAMEVSFSSPISVVAGRAAATMRIACGATRRAWSGRRQAEGQRRLALAAVDRLDAGAENLAQQRGTLEPEADARRR